MCLAKTCRNFASRFVIRSRDKNTKNKETILRISERLPIHIRHGPVISILESRTCRVDSPFEISNAESHLNCARHNNSTECDRSPQ